MSNNTRKLRLRGIVVATSIALAAQAAFAAGAQPAPRVDLSAIASDTQFDRFIVKYKDGTPEASSPAALNRSLVEDGWFDPIIPMIEDEDGEPAEGDEALQGLGYWAAGFEWAMANFPHLEEAGLAGVPDLLDSIWRHLPEQDEAQQAITKALNEDHPLKGLDEAIEALVFDVVDLAQIGLAESHKVETVIREHPKLGRNDPCHCGSGKKYKNCHGAN